MALATYKDLCIDANDASLLGDFYGALLGLTVEHLDDGDARLSGPTPQHTIWVNTVLEPRSVKQRVHLDIWTTLSAASALGARTLDEQPEWTVLADPEGGELCVFREVHETVTPRKALLVVDTGPDAGSLAEWWAAAFGAEVHHDESGMAKVTGIAGCPWTSFWFVPVPEPKVVKNRVHVDVFADVDELVAAGARVIATLEHWTVMADPEGNEFCAFAPR